MTALADLFRDDATFVNVRGTYMRGREEIREGHGLTHAGPYRNATLSAEVQDVREVVPGVIVAHLRTEVRGDERTPEEVRHSLLTLVIERQADLWLIVTGHNTVVVPPPG
jgi:uncharacterized protein (TIGR02246 family)